MTIIALNQPPTIFVASISPGVGSSGIIGHWNLINNRTSINMNGGGQDFNFVGSTRRAIKYLQIISRLDMSKWVILISDYSKMGLTSLVLYFTQVVTDGVRVQYRFLLY